MIFCFTGTGNSLHVAQKIAMACNEEVIMMTEKEKRKNKKYILKPREKLGFVFPVYWWGVPALVEEFVKNMTIENYSLNYTYAVATFGLGKGNASEDLEKILCQKGIMLQATYEVKMVDNYVVGYELAEEKKKHEILITAEQRIEEITQHILNEQRVKVKRNAMYFLRPFVHFFYKNTDHHKKFYVTEACIGCGKCEKQCPCQVIRLENQAPVWENNCSFCLKCIHTCPQKAIQYGKGTEKRSRYYFPKHFSVSAPKDEVQVKTDKGSHKLVLAGILLALSCLVYLLVPVVIASRMTMCMKAVFLGMIEAAAWIIFFVAGIFGGKELWNCWSKALSHAKKLTNNYIEKLFFK